MCQNKIVLVNVLDVEKTVKNYSFSDYSKFPFFFIWNHAVSAINCKLLLVARPPKKEATLALDTLAHSTQAAMYLRNYEIDDKRK